MALNLGYFYAEIDSETGECLGVFASTLQRPQTENIIPIPTDDDGYIGKYYINGSWYEDENGTIPYIPA